MRQNSPFLAVSTFFTLAFGGCLLIQAMGHYLNISLVHVSLPLAALASLIVTYGYFFIPTRRTIAVLAGVCLAFALLGIISTHLYDMTSDGMGYQQPSAEAILNGWNPLHHDAAMLWQNIYPSGAWELEASLASAYGSIEAAKMLQFFWLFIASTTLLVGLRHYVNGPLGFTKTLIALLIPFCPVVLCEALTHYVDAMLYLAGITFLGALLLTSPSSRGGNADAAIQPGHVEGSKAGLPRYARNDVLAWLLMSTAILFIVNAKLSGIYHAVILCLCAVVFIWMGTKRIPYTPAFILGGAGIVATLVLGFHPYITNFQTYGALLHMDSEKFSAFQRPANLTPMHSPQRFFYSVFSETGGHPRAPAKLKMPGLIRQSEWTEAGAPDSRTGGFGVLFALACIGSLILLILSKKPDRKLLTLSAILFASSIAFPENWWARYVPFAYTAVLLALIALPRPEALIMRITFTCVIILFCLNSMIATVSAYNYFRVSQLDFIAMAARLREQPQGSVYLVPPGDDYEIYNHAHMPITRRLKMLGVETTIKVGAPCPHRVAELSEFKLCY